MDKINYKKDYKDIYLPKAVPVLIDVPEMTYIMVDGKGAPQEQEYQNAVSLLYALSYTIKMNGKEIDGYYDYGVFPLEGLWWCEDEVFDFNKRDTWRWISMIRQPDFVTADVFPWATELAGKKKTGLDFSRTRFETLAEGLCVQMMHVGPYADESVTLEKLRKFMAQNELTDMTGAERKHHEIYLSDPNRTKPDKLNTVIRLPVSQ